MGHEWGLIIFFEKLSLLISLLTMASMALANSPADITVSFPYLQMSLQKTSEVEKSSFGFQYEQDIYSIETRMADGDTSERSRVPAYGLYYRKQFWTQFNYYIEATGTKFILPIFPTRLGADYSLYETPNFKVGLQAGVGIFAAKHHHILGVSFSSFQIGPRWVPFLSAQFGRDTVGIEEADHQDKHVLFQDIERYKSTILAGFEYKSGNITIRLYGGHTAFSHTDSDISRDDVILDEIDKSGAVWGLKFDIE